MATTTRAMTFPWGRRLLPVVWYLEAALLAGAVWALWKEGGLREALGASAYLALCGAAAGLPGSLFLWLATRAELEVLWRRRLLHLYLALAAGAVAALLGSGRAWGATATILLTGNALWAIEVEARRVLQAEASPGD